MKKEVVFLFAIFLIFSFVSAVEFDVKTSYDKDETFIARISGNFFTSPNQGNIIFFKEHTRVSIIPTVQKIGTDFYVYAQLLGKIPGNYSIMMENAKYYQSGILTESDLSKNFTISENQSEFTINPGVIFTKSNFSIQVQNLLNSQITLGYGIFNDSAISDGDGGFFDSFFGSTSSDKKYNKIILKSGEIKKIDFNKDDFFPFEVQEIELSTNNMSYLIPVYINANKTQNISEEKTHISFETSEFNITLPLNSNTSRIVYLFNLGENDLSNVEILFSDSLKPYISLSENNISEIGKNKSEKIEIFFNSNGMEQTITGQIKAKTQDDFYAYIDVSLNFVKNFQPSENDSSVPLCSEKSGTICGDGEFCSGNSEISSDGNCCLDSCIQETADSGIRWKIIGWIIVLAIILFVSWFYFFKYKKTKNVVDLLKVARRR